MLSSARSFSKQVLNHRTQIQQQTKSQLRNQHNGPTRPKDQQQLLEDDIQQQQQRQDVLGKMRQENRERKKRWREMNDERNKDNDLRCRVNKRANQLYGAHASADKERWVGEEFERRQQRRRDKETRKRPQGEEGEGEGMEVEDGNRDTLLTHSVDDVVVVGIPTGFGSYASLPTHQVRAAYGFWKNVAGHHALEAADPGGDAVRRRNDCLPLLASARAGQSDASSATLVASSPASMSPPPLSASTLGQKQEGVWLPPLSSVVPEEFRQPLVRPSVSAAAAPSHSPCPGFGVGNYSGHVASAQGTPHHHPLATMNTGSHAAAATRHMRPWEEEAEESRCMDQPRSPSLSTSSLPPPPFYYQQQRDDDGLSEAAFSLMTLSSSSSTSSASVADLLRR
ncbi:hypothetical protein IWW38_000567 [Coemansia aciculifera]|uniref:Uncharacterized protein n=1 Tax=Coemansia aciculifera TaxID=417176 RepID=A0ACC1M8Q8_9FUNG|nr:hypothetical protein IWW38_000567 [Coemansia aciculifera]